MRPCQSPQSYIMHYTLHLTQSLDSTIDSMHRMAHGYSENDLLPEISSIIAFCQSHLAKLEYCTCNRIGRSSTYPRTRNLFYDVSCRLGTSSSVQKEPREPTYCNCESSNSYPKYVLPWSRPIQLSPSNFKIKHSGHPRILLDWRRQQFIVLICFILRSFLTFNHPCTTEPPKTSMSILKANIELPSFPNYCMLLPQPIASLIPQLVYCNLRQPKIRLQSTVQ